MNFRLPVRKSGDVYVVVSANFLQIFRRRREGKTDYGKRRGIIVGKSEFLTISISSKYIYAQIHKATQSGDLTLCSTASSDLEEASGWKGATKNLPAAYLTGYLLGRRA